jgi:hypothetical protein
MALRAGLGLQAVAGIEPSAAWQGGGVSWLRQLNITGCLAK